MNRPAFHPAFPCVLSSGFSSASLSHYLEHSFLQSSTHETAPTSLWHGCCLSLCSLSCFKSLAWLLLCLCSLSFLGLKCLLPFSGLMLTFTSSSHQVRCNRTNRWDVPENQLKGTRVWGEESGIEKVFGSILAPI